MYAMQLLGSLLGNSATASRNSNQMLNQLVRSLTSVGSTARGTSTASFGRGSSDMASLLGGLAMSALQSFSQRGGSSSQSPLAALSGLLGGAGASSSLASSAQTQGPAKTTTLNPETANQQALTLVRAMINAAKADGHIDDQERRNILGRLNNVGPEELQFVRQELTQDLNMDFLNDVDTSQAPEIYMVSLMAIDLDTPAEHQYLQQLAQQLRLDSQTVNSLHQSLGLAGL